MPPAACSAVMASSVVGVVARPILTTSKPIPSSAPQTQWLTISPEMRASRPTTILFSYCPTKGRRSIAKAVTDFTMSSGLSVSPVSPPIVPRKPAMDLISVILIMLFWIRSGKGCAYEGTLFLRREASCAAPHASFGRKTLAVSGQEHDKYTRYLAIMERSTRFFPYKSSERDAFPAKAETCSALLFVCGTLHLIL